MNNEEISIGIKADITEFLEGLNEATYQVKKTKKDIENNNGIDLGFTSTEDKLKKQLEFWKTSLSDALGLGADKNEINEIKEQIKKVKEQIEQINGGKNGLNDWIKNATRFALRVAGIRSVALGVRKVVMSAVNDSKELQNTFTGFTKMLGTAISPIIEWVASLLKKFMQFVNNVYYGFTGVNLLAKAMSNAKKNASALKSVLAGFDELNVLDNSSNANNWWSTLTGTSKITGIGEELRKKFEDARKILKDWYEKAIKPILDKIAEFFKVEFPNVPQEVVTDIDRKITDVVLKVKDGLGEIVEVSSNAEQFIVDKNGRIVAEFIEGVGYVDKETGKAYENIVDYVKDTGVEIGMVAKSVEEMNSIADMLLKNKQKLEDFPTWFKTNVANKVGTYLKNSLTTTITAKYSVNDTSKTSTSTKGVIASGEAKYNMQAYALGTNYVPNDQIALLHKGEAVIPKEFNGTQGKAYTDNGTALLLEELIDVVKRKRINIDGKTIGEKSTDYINEMTRLTGRSVLI